jgi:hypothetical protein
MRGVTFRFCDFENWSVIFFLLTPDSRCYRLYANPPILIGKIYLFVMVFSFTFLGHCQRDSQN